MAVINTTPVTKCSVFPREQTAPPKRLHRLVTTSVKQLFFSLFFTALTLSAAGVTGKWSGSIERIGGPLGGVRTDEHFLTLKQTGDTITGTAGPKRDVQWEIVNARLDGNILTFETSIPRSANLVFVYKLELTGQELAGSMEFKPPKDVSWKLRLKREP